MNPFNWIGPGIIASGCLGLSLVCFTVAWAYAKAETSSIRHNARLFNPSNSLHRVAKLLVWSTLAVLFFLGFWFSVRLTF